MFLFLAVGNHRHAGGQLGFALPESVPRLQQLAEQVGDGAGQHSDSPVLGFVPTGCRVHPAFRPLSIAPFFLFVSLSFFRCRRFEHKATGRLPAASPRMGIDHAGPADSLGSGRVLVSQGAAGGGLERSQEFRQAADGFGRRLHGLRRLFRVEF